MEQNKFQNGLIYTIKTDNGIYVGSTCDFAQRKKMHKYHCFNEKSKSYNIKLYQNIRENGGEYTMEIYKLFPCNSHKELCIEEEEVRKFLNSNLNSHKCFITKEERKEYHKKQNKEYRQNNKEFFKEYNQKNKQKIKEYNQEYKQKNKEIISQKKSEIVTCECGCKATKVSIARHRKSKKHLNLMELKNFASAS